MTAHPGAIIQVTGGGSGTGIAALINGTTDICMSSRPMKEDEKRKLRDRYQTMGVEIPVAKDGLVDLRQRAEPGAAAVARAAARDLHRRGRPTGSRSAATTRRSCSTARENNSGTYVYFKDHVLLGPRLLGALPDAARHRGGGERGRPRSRTASATAARPTPRACASVAVSKDAQSRRRCMPTAATVRDGSYPITRDLYFYTRTQPSRGRRRSSWTGCCRRTARQRRHQGRLLPGPLTPLTGGNAMRARMRPRSWSPWLAVARARRTAAAARRARRRSRSRARTPW